MWLLLLFGLGVSAFAIAGTQPTASAVRGLRNRNPGNLRANAFLGFQRLDDAGYAIFDTLAHGNRGAARQLRLYFARGINTIRSIVSTWAPSSENDTERYIDNMEQWVGRSRDAVLQLDEATHLALLRGIYRKELGTIAAATISDADILAAIRSSV